MKLQRRIERFLGHEVNVGKLNVFSGHGVKLERGVERFSGHGVVEESSTFFKTWREEPNLFV